MLMEFKANLLGLSAGFGASDTCHLLVETNKLSSYHFSN